MVHSVLEAESSDSVPQQLKGMPRGTARGYTPLCHWDTVLHKTKTNVMITGTVAIVTATLFFLLCFSLSLL